MIFHFQKRLEDSLFFGGLFLLGRIYMKVRTRKQKTAKLCAFFLLLILDFSFLKLWLF